VTGKCPKYTKVTFNVIMQLYIPLSNYDYSAQFMNSRIHIPACFVSCGKTTLQRLGETISVSAGFDVT